MKVRSDIFVISFVAGYRSVTPRARLAEMSVLWPEGMLQKHPFACQSSVLFPASQPLNSYIQDLNHCVSNCLQLYLPLAQNLLQDLATPGAHQAMAALLPTLHRPMRALLATATHQGHSGTATIQCLPATTLTQCPPAMALT